MPQRFFDSKGNRLRGKQPFLDPHRLQERIASLFGRRIHQT
jgi:hypothetical protein